MLYLRVVWGREFETTHSQHLLILTSGVDALKQTIRKRHFVVLEKSLKIIRFCFQTSK